MSLGQHQFHDLGTVTDLVLALFDQWEKDVLAGLRLDSYTFYRAKLAVYEWMANLVQHADFGERTPDIRFEIHPNGKSVYCVIEDNSAGFNLNEALRARQDALNRLPDRGMGLLMLRSCTNHLSYQRVDHATHRLEFTVSSDPEACFQIPFEL